MSARVSVQSELLSALQRQEDEQGTSDASSAHQLPYYQLLETAQATHIR